jgi:hypothetical protein
MSERFFHGPDGIAGVDIGTDVAFSSGLDQGHKLVALHVASVVLDGDFDAFSFSE